MKQKLLIFIILAFLIALLAGLNAATYVQKEKVADTELDPNRSTYNSGSTGTQAFFSLLAETGRKATRWQTSVETIASDIKNRPSVFVMIGPLRRELTDAENTELMKWVADGGTLVLIDRNPPTELAMTTSQWQMSVAASDSKDLYTVDGSDQKQMTSGTGAQKPVQPSGYAHGVNAVQPSRFASSITLERFGDSGTSATERPGNKTGTANDLYPVPTPTPYDFYSENRLPPPPAKEWEKDPHIPTSAADEGTGDGAFGLLDEEPEFEAPIVHLAGSGRNLLVEAPFDQGRVIILSDPYIVSNAGINLVDNSRLAANLVTSRDGVIAFDEYHHGYGTNNNRFFQYFDGTPVIAIFVQCGLLVALVFFSQSRRFARPVPESEPSRLSKLEYVSAMAELQQRTRAYDLAIENIYSDFRRRSSSLVGLDNTIASGREIAGRIAERIGGGAGDIEELMFQCEEIIRGEPVGRKETVALVERIRKIEEMLGLKRSGRKGV